MRHRRYLIVISLNVHLALVFGLFVAGFWKLDRLEAARRPFDLTVMPPPAAASGGPAATKHEPFKKKQSKVIPTEITQPTVKRATEDKPATTEPTTTGDGTGSGGPGSGSGSDPTGTGTCTEEPCGPPGDPPQPQPPKPEPPRVEPPIPVVPSVIRGMRISGETQIQPPDVEKTALMRSGTSRASATVKVCVGETGNIVSLTMYKGSGYRGWDAAILSALRNWRYKPHRIGERAVTVCGMVTFLYEIR